MSKTVSRPMWIKTPAFEKTSNFKEFFLMDDAMCHLESELVFSIFKRYTCHAGCDMCYINDEWVDNTIFADKFTPATVPTDVESRILDVFGYFDIVTTMDDLYYIKHQHPELFKFYVRNSHLMSLTSMTDMAFIQQCDIVLDELNFESVYEISFSDRFLNKNEGKLVDIVLRKLSQMISMLPIRKIKIILCDATEQSAEGDSAVRKLISWCEEHSVFIDIHDDIRQGKNRRYELTRANSQSTNHVQDDTQSFIYQILREVTYLQYTSMFLTISQATVKDSTPFYDIADGTTFDVKTFVAESIKHKIRTYREYATMLRATCERIDSIRNKYLDYFTYVINHVIVHDNYSFIPRFMLKPYTRLYTKLQSVGFIDTPYGLWLQSTSMTPIIEVGDHYRQRLEHIPVVGTSVQQSVKRTISDIRSLVKDGNMAHAMDELHTMILSPDFRLYINAQIQDSHIKPFIMNAISQFSMTIGATDEDEYDEPDYGCVMSPTRFLAQIVTTSDVATQFLHTVLHEWCKNMWVLVPTDKGHFSLVERDVLEEVYSQCIINTVAPQRSAAFHDNIKKYAVIRGIELPKSTLNLLTLMMPTASTGDIGLDEAHAWLYAQNIFSQQTFNDWVHRFMLAHNHPLLIEYDNTMRKYCK